MYARSTAQSATLAIVNWKKWFLSADAALKIAEPAWLDSLAAQTRWLRGRLVPIPAALIGAAARLAHRPELAQRLCGSLHRSTFRRPAARSVGGLRSQPTRPLRAPPSTFSRPLPEACLRTSHNRPRMSIPALLILLLLRHDQT